MPERRTRLDAYGRPLPTLADAREQSLLDTPANLEGRRSLQDLLQESYHLYLRRGMSINVKLSFIVKDGTIQPQAWVQTSRRYSRITTWREPEEER